MHPSGYYAWRIEPRSARDKDDMRLTGLIKQFWLKNGGICGYRKIHRDLRDIGRRCGKHRPRRMMRLAGLRAQVGCRRPRRKPRPASVVCRESLHMISILIYRQLVDACSWKKWLWDADV